MDIGKEQNKSKFCLNRFESKAAAGILCIVYLLVVMLTLAIGWTSVHNTDDPILMKAGFIAALTGFSIIALQVMLGSRLKMLDRAFGLDKVVMLHRKMGILAAVLLISHPLLMALGNKSLKIFAFHTSWQINMGKGALFLMLLGVLIALYYSKFRLDYNAWRLFHKAMILVVIFAFAHSILIGDAFDIIWVKVWWWGLMIIACAAFFRQNFIIIPFGRKKYIVKSVIKETHDTFTLILEPAGNPGKSVFNFKPGQFMFLEFQYGSIKSEEHPFTISSPPTVQGHITATIKKSGNFTEMIDQTQISSRAMLQGPFGRFSYYFDNPSCFLFIAGGVGITPIHSMIATLRDTGDTRPVVLLYVNKTEGDILFHDELEKLPANFKVILILSRAGKEWKGLTGHLNADVIRQQADGMLEKADVYLCGPSAMMELVINELLSIGVFENRIHYERFSI